MDPVMVIPYGDGGEERGEVIARPLPSLVSRGGNAGIVRV